MNQNILTDSSKNTQLEERIINFYSKPHHPVRIIKEENNNENVNRYSIYKDLPNPNSFSSNELIRNKAIIESYKIGEISLVKNEKSYHLKFHIEEENANNISKTNNWDMGQRPNWKNLLKFRIEMITNTKGDILHHSYTTNIDKSVPWTKSDSPEVVFPEEYLLEFCKTKISQYHTSPPTNSTNSL